MIITETACSRSHEVIATWQMVHLDGARQKKTTTNKQQQQQQQQQQRKSSAHGDWLNSRHQYLGCHGKDETRHQHIQLNAVQTWNQFKQSSKRHCIHEIWFQPDCPEVTLCSGQDVKIPLLMTST